MNKVQLTASPDSPISTASFPDAGPYNLGRDLDEVIADLPDAVKAAMQKVIPEQYTPEFAARFAAGMIAVLRESQQDTPASGVNVFTDKATGKQVTFTCLPGCSMDHSADRAVPQHPDDVYCIVPGDEGSLSLVGSLCEGRGAEEFRLLGWHIDVHPFSSHIAQRQPVANVEVIDDHYTEDLDPDGLAYVIDVLQSRVDSLRTAHTRLVELRAAYQAGTGTSA